MKKLGLLLGVVALLVPSLVLAGDIKIGLMCPLTGKWASEGQDMKNIVSLLVDSARDRLSAALLLTKNKGRDTISQNPKMPNNPSV